MLTKEELEKKQYGIPEQRKFPLDTRAHVISAIKFFNYAEPKYRKALATKLISKIKEYGIKVTPSDDNQFYKYYKPTSSFIAHYGVSKANGAKVGSGRYPLGSGKEPQSENNQRNYNDDVFVIKKGTVFNRITPDRKESKDSFGKYASYSDTDKNVYTHWANLGMLGHKKSNTLYNMRFEAMDDIYVMKGDSAINNVVAQIGDKSLTEAYWELHDIGYFNDNQTVDNRRDKMGPVVNGKHYLYTKLAQDSTSLFEAARDFKYRTPNRDDYLNAMATRYDAVIDSEDFMDGKVTAPLILLNSDKIKYKDITKLSKKDIKAANKWIDDLLAS